MLLVHCFSPWNGREEGLSLGSQVLETGRDKLKRSLGRTGVADRESRAGSRGFNAVEVCERCSSTVCEIQATLSTGRPGAH